MESLLWVIVAAAGLLAPKHQLLMVGVPLLMIASTCRAPLLPPALSIGDADVYGYDLVLAFVAFRLVFARAAASRPGGPVDGIVRSNVVRILVFVGVLLAATLLAALRFGSRVAVPELIALARFLAQVSTFFLLFQSVPGRSELAGACRGFHVTGYMACASVYLSLVLYSMFSIVFGEIVDTRGVVRYFGPIGDQVGFILNLFVFQALLAGRALVAALFAGAVFASGTRGAILALVLGTGIVYFLGRDRQGRTRVGRKIVLAGALVALAVASNVLSPGLLDRFLKPEHVSGSAAQRQFSMSLGVRMFLDNPVLGVGYSGFRLIAADYDRELQDLRGPELERAVSANANNLYVQVATDAGLVGVLAFLSLIASALRLLRRGGRLPMGDARRLSTAGYVWLWSLLIGNQASAWLVPGSLTGYLFLALLAFAARSVSLAAAVQAVRPGPERAPPPGADRVKGWAPPQPAWSER